MSYSVYLSAEYYLEQAIEKFLRLYVKFLPAPGFEKERIKKILICAYHGLGNFILYAPAIKAIRDHFPDAEIHLQVGNNTACEEVLEKSGIFQKIIDVGSNAGWRAWLSRIRDVRREKYDLIINEFHSNSYFLAMMVAFSRAPYRLGHVESPGWPARYSFLYNLPVKMKENQHEVDRYFELARTIGVPQHLYTRKLFIHLTDSDYSFAEEFLNQHGVEAADTLIGVQVGTSESMRWKQWPPERFTQLCQRIQADFPAVKLILLGSPGEAQMVRSIAGQLNPRPIIAAGETTVRQAAALIERCSLLVCNDSGLMHMAVAVGTPVLAIYGPTDFHRTAPLGSIHTIIRKDLPCSPCFKLDGMHRVNSCDHKQCLNTMQVDEVFQALKLKIKVTAHGEQ